MIRVRPEAKEDLQSAYDWYEDREPGLGERLLDRVAGIYERILENPRLFPLAYAGFRRAILRRFPYCVYFTIEEDYILIVGVLHGRQDLQRLVGRRRSH